MNKNPHVSIILCNYNHGLYLQEAIESILTQTYTNIEVIIVDDGSTDDSSAVIEKFNDCRIQAIFQDNQGQASALNTGYKRASGKYVAFLDSDDFWRPNKIQESMQIFEAYEGISLVQHPLEILDGESRMQGVLHPNVEYAGQRNVLREYYLQNHTNFFSPTSGLVVAKDVLDKIFPLDASWKICADVLFTRPLPLFGDVYYLNKPLGYYRIHDNNTWMNTEKQKRDYDNNILYVEYTNKWLDKMGKSRNIRYEKSIPYARQIRNQYTMSQPEWYLHTSILTAKKIVASLRSW